MARHEVTMAQVRNEARVRRQPMGRAAIEVYLPDGSKLSFWSTRAQTLDEIIDGSTMKALRAVRDARKKSARSRAKKA